MSEHSELVARASNERLSQIREHDFPILLEFHSKHALGPLTRPSCLVCGRVPEQWPPAIQHAELPGIVVCHPCRDRATHETSERQPAVAVLREVLENISTVSPLEHFPAVTALAYCREKAIEALNATSAFQEVIVGEYEADGKVNMASSPLPEGTKLYARLPLRHSEKAGEQPLWPWQMCTGCGNEPNACTCDTQSEPEV